MGKFASASRQATSIITDLQQKKVIKSLGTARNYKQALTLVAKFAINNNITLRDLDHNYATQYLGSRSMIIGQKTLDMERQAIQALMHYTGQLSNNKSIKANSKRPQVLSGRAYTATQVAMISDRQKEDNQLATKIAYAAGLRAHELLTLLPATERHADDRPSLESKFMGRDGIIYTVIGKGGLVREVLIPIHLANKLEKKRLAVPVKVLDRTIYYLQHYQISAGNKFSASFNIASNKVLKRSTGAHGLRHSYAQERMVELQKLGLSRADSLKTASQEMGHFRPEITETYLR